ncbi:hypothetical protein ACNQFN_11060 [Thauera butanivorans]|uniref:hypothetical protein n=1 Tax=Thauera butanivorans TaxID=86174 RepID=UPI003AB74D39
MLNNLGCTAGRTVLKENLSRLDLPASGLCQARNGDMYRFGISGHGLDLMLQCLNPHVPDAERQWGLHSLTFHTARSEPASFWRQKWPSGIDPDTATAGDIVSLLAEDDDDAVLMTDGMACFEVPGFDDRRWIVQCMFDPASKTLLTFSLVRSGDWVHTQKRSEEAGA